MIMSYTHTGNTSFYNLKPNVTLLKLAMAHTLGEMNN